MNSCGMLKPLMIYLESGEFPLGVEINHGRAPQRSSSVCVDLEN